MIRCKISNARIIRCKVSNVHMIICRIYDMHTVRCKVTGEIDPRICRIYTFCSPLNIIQWFVIYPVSALTDMSLASA
jgi:hypothetical protein